MNDACRRDRVDVAFRVFRILAVIVAVLVLGAVPAHSFDVSAPSINPLSPTTVYAETDETTGPGGAELTA